jgi:hypothetical protein
MQHLRGSGKGGAILGKRNAVDGLFGGLGRFADHCAIVGIIDDKDFGNNYQ